MSDGLTDDEVVAELRDDEARMFHRLRGATLIADFEITIIDVLHRLAAARRGARELRELPCRIVGRTTMHCATCEATVREAVAAEREACAALCDEAATAWEEVATNTRDVEMRSTYDWRAVAARELADRIRRRGGA